MAGVLKRLFQRQSVFRPDVEAQLDAELKRHGEALKKLVAYAIEQEQRQAQASGETNGGTERERRPDTFNEPGAQPGN